MKILTACNEKYWPYAERLINSVLKNTDYEVVLRAIDFTPKISSLRVRVDFDKPGLKGMDQIDYAANIRVEMLKNDLGSLWLDADSIVRGPLDELEKMLEDNVTIAYRRLELPFDNFPEHKYLISTVGISVKGEDFVNDWLRILTDLRTNEPQYYRSIMTCQLAYYIALINKEHLFKSIPLKFTDMTFQDGSPVWEMQGNRKTDPRAVAEMAKYA